MLYLLLSVIYVNSMYLKVIHSFQLTSEDRSRIQHVNPFFCLCKIPVNCYEAQHMRGNGMMFQYSDNTTLITISILYVHICRSTIWLQKNVLLSSQMNSIYNFCLINCFIKMSFSRKHSIYLNNCFCISGVIFT